MNAPEESTIWRFVDCELNQATRELRVRGQLVPLEPKPLDLLLCLLRHGNAAVSKDELLQEVWPGRVISETVLARTVMKLRKALNDPAQEIVATAHGYGYRLAVPAQKNLPAKPAVLTELSALRPRWHMGAMLAIAIALTLAAILTWNRLGTATVPRLALLPVQVEAGAAPEWMGLGLMALLADKLARDFDVLSPGQVLARVESTPAQALPEKIGRLRAAYGPLQVLEVSLARQADGVRLRYALHRQDQTTMEGHIDAGDPIAAAMLMHERLRLELGAEGRLTRHTPMAEGLYARGRAANLRGDARSARDYLAAALREDPGMVWARYELALTQRQLGELPSAQSTLNELTAEADPRLALSAHNALGILHWRGGRLDLAETHLRQARSLAETHHIQGKLPKLLLNLGILHSSRGQFEEAQVLWQRALNQARILGDRNVEADVYNSLGVQAWDQGDVDRSYAEHARALEIRRTISIPRDLAASLNNLATVAMTRGRWDEARGLLEEAHSLRTHLGDLAGLASTQNNLAWLAVRQGHWEDAERRILQTRALAEDSGYAQTQAKSWLLQAELAQARAEPGKARAYYQTAINIFEGGGQAHFADSARLHQARLPGSDPGQGRALAEAILARQDLEAKLEADALLLYAQLMAADQPGIAEQAWRRALEHADRRGDRELSVQVSLAFGEYLLSRRRLADMEPLLGRLGAWPEYAPALAMQAAYWQARGNMERALDYLRRARDAAHDAWKADDQARLAALEELVLVAAR